MTNNLMPWLVLGAIVLVSLYWKGYFKLPSLGAQPPAPPVASVAKDPYPEIRQATRPYLDPSLMSSHDLAVLMASAARREAEQEVAGKIAKDAAEKVKAAFASPFSAGEPAPADAKPGDDKTA